MRMTQIFCTALIALCGFTANATECDENRCATLGSTDRGPCENGYMTEYECAYRNRGGTCGLMKIWVRRRGIQCSSSSHTSVVR